MLYPKYSLVKVKKLTAPEWDPENIVIPSRIESKEDKKQFTASQKKIIKAMKKFEGELLFVMNVSEEDNETHKTFYQLFSPELETIEISSDLSFPIGLLEDEIELVYDDVLNNCCKEKFAHTGFTLGFKCDNCSFSFADMVREVA